MIKVIAYIKCSFVNLDYLKRRIKEVGLLESSKNLTNYFTVHLFQDSARLT